MPITTIQEKVKNQKRSKNVLQSTENMHIMRSIQEVLFNPYSWEIFSAWTCNWAHFYKFNCWLSPQQIRKEWMSQANILKAEKNNCLHPVERRQGTTTKTRAIKPTNQPNKKPLSQDLKTLVTWGHLIYGLNSHQPVICPRNTTCCWIFTMTTLSH